MYKFSPNGTPCKIINSFTLYGIGLASDYALPQYKGYRYKKYKPKPTEPYTEKWQNDFYFLAKDFCFETDVIADIIYEIMKRSKPNDTNDALYIRAMNKMLDIL